MKAQEGIDVVAAALKSAKSYVEIFGKLPEGLAELKAQALRGQFAYLAKIVHPDHVAEERKTEAASIFIELKKLRSGAQEAIRMGTYDKPFVTDVEHLDENLFTSATVLQSGIGLYRLDENPFNEGDFSTLYTATVLPKGTRRVIIKIAADPSFNPWLEHEARILSRFAAAKPGIPIYDIRAFLPTIVDTFTISERGGKRYRANVLAFVPDLISLTEVAKVFPKGLDPRDAAWIFRRVLAQALAASMAGMVHGAIVPDHVLVHPTTHEPLHIGWAHALDTTANPNTRITHVIDRWKDWYPPEVFLKKQPEHKTDLYMAGKTMIYLLGGDTKRNAIPHGVVPEKIGRIILQCVENSLARRPDDGRRILDEFTRAVKEQWGRVHRPLHMPSAH